MTLEELLSRCTPDPTTGCLLWPKRDIDGYGHVTVARRWWKTHRLAYVLKHGPIPPGPYRGTWIVRHKCDVRACCNPDHLELGTFADNVEDAKRRGRYPSGDNHWTRKYNNVPKWKRDLLSKSSV